MLTKTNMDQTHRIHKMTFRLMMTIFYDGDFDASDDHSDLLIRLLFAQILHWRPGQRDLLLARFKSHFLNRSEYIS